MSLPMLPGSLPIGLPSAATPGTAAAQGGNAPTLDDVISATLGNAGQALAAFVQRWGQLGAQTNAGVVNTPLPTVQLHIPQGIPAVSGAADTAGGLLDYLGGAYELANNLGRMGTAGLLAARDFAPSNPFEGAAHAVAQALLPAPGAAEPNIDALLATGHPLAAHELGASGNELTYGVLDQLTNPLNYLGILSEGLGPGASLAGRLGELAKAAPPESLTRFAQAFEPLLPKGAETLAPAGEIALQTPDQLLGPRQEIPYVERALQQAGAGAPAQPALDLDPVESAIKRAVDTAGADAQAQVAARAADPLAALPAQYTPEQAALAPYYSPQHQPLVPYTPNVGLLSRLGGAGAQLGTNAVATANTLLNGPAEAATGLAGKGLKALADGTGLSDAVAQAVQSFGGKVPATVGAATDLIQRLLGGERVTGPEAAATLVKAQLPDIAAETPAPRDVLAYFLARQPATAAAAEEALPGTNQAINALAAANAGTRGGGLTYLGNLLNQVGYSGAKDDVVGALTNLAGDDATQARENLINYLTQRLVEKGGTARLGDAGALGPLASPSLQALVEGLPDDASATAAELKSRLMDSVGDLLGRQTAPAGEQLPQELAPGLYEDARDFMQQTLKGRQYLPGASYLQKFARLEPWESRAIYQRLLSDPSVVQGLDHTGSPILADAIRGGAAQAPLPVNRTPTPSEAQRIIQQMLGKNPGITPQTPEAWNTLVDLASYAVEQGKARQAAMRALGPDAGQRLGTFGSLKQSFFQQKQKPRSVVTDLMTDVLNAGALGGATPDEIWRNIGNKLQTMRQVGPATRYIQPLNDVLMKMGMPDAEVKTGKSFADAIGALDDQNSLVRSALNEALLTLMPGNWHTIPLGGPVLGAIRGYYRPFQVGMYRALNDVTRGGTAETVAAREGARGLGVAQQMFLDRLGRQGVDTTPLRAALAQKGAWDAADLTRAYGNRAGQNLADTWAALMEANRGLMERRVRDVLGSYESMSGAEKAFRVAFPFSGWVWKQTGMLKDMLLQHPGVALGLLNLYHLGAQHTFQQGLPGEDTGIPISTDTPLLGGLARAELGGQSGTYYWDPLEGPLPYGGRTLDAREYLSKQGALGKIQWAMDAGALQANPLFQTVLEAAGKGGDAAGLGIPSYDTLGGLDERMPGPLLPTATHFLDLLHQALGGSAMETPEDRAMADVVFQRTGLPISSPYNTQAALEAMTPGTDLYNAAEALARNGSAAGSLVNYVLPSYHGPVSAEDQALAYARAHAEYQPWEILSAMQNDPAQAAQEQYANSVMRYVLPLLGVHSGIDQQSLINQALLGYRGQNAAVADLLGQAWAPYQQAEAQRLGLFAAGTLGQPASPADYAVQGGGSALLDLLGRPVAGPGTPSLLDLLSPPQR